MEEKKGLSPKAYEIIDGNEYPPFVEAEENMPELTMKAIIIGALIGAVFGAANAYLGLRVGLTVSASIPAAVMAVAIFKVLRSGTILETNMVQTIGSAGESLAAGVCFTIPAFFLWDLSPSQFEIIVISILGGVMGVLFMIPLRKYLIVEEHGKLPYPEGTACAEVLIAGQGDVSRAKPLFYGMGLGGIYQFLMNNDTFALWAKDPEFHFKAISSKLSGMLLAAEITPELLGVGYIVGPRIAAIMFAGGLLGWFVLIPLIMMFGQHIGVAIYPETAVALKDMGEWAIWSKYVRYIGAGGVAFAGIFSLFKSIPVIVQSFVAGVKGLTTGSNVEEKRTQKDLPMTLILFGSLFLSVAIAVYLCSTVFKSNIMAGMIAAVLVVVFSFFFVTVSSRIVGLLGSSSNPISGMTIATLILTCMAFLAAGLGGMENVNIAVLSVGAFVCIAAAIAGDTSQDLKTGFLIGATPKKQQIGEFIGVVAAGLTMGSVMYLLKDGIVSGEYPAPQANLMKIVVDGVMGDTLPWALVMSGVFISIFIEMLGINSLAFAVGLYLPMSLSVPIMIGGLIRMWVDYSKKDPKQENRREAGVLYCSGLIAGAALVGLFIAGIVSMRGDSGFIAGIGQTLKRPGVVFVDSSQHKIKVDKKDIIGSYSSSALAFKTDKEVKEIHVQWTNKDKLYTKSIPIKKWDKKWVSVNGDKLDISSHVPNATNKGVFAFLLLALSLIWIVRPIKE
ncbi:MAG: oligopeptide transporter, OPT family [Candidatus Cloacimonadota bacterium]|nr:MAG: oligopeptide transporter, OPT family [Candidatus Cloacimonadota bacterium]